MTTTYLTDRTVRGLEPPEFGQRVVWDEAVPGFGVRLSYGGTKSWVVTYRQSGRKRWLTLGTYPDMRLATARSRAREARLEVFGGADPATEKRLDRRAPTFAELAEEYLERHAKPNKRTWRTDERMIGKDLLPRWRNVQAKEITRRDVIDLLDSIVDRGAPIQANRTLALVRKIFNFAIERALLESNPCRMVKPPGKETQRERVLSKAEIRDVWSALFEDPNLISNAYRLRLLTAQRGGEVLSMRWQDIDSRDALWTIPAERSKNEKPHRVPLSSQSLSVLEAISGSRGRAPWVFPSPTVDGEPMKYWQSANQRLREASEVKRFRPHDLRRTAASFMASRKVPRTVIKKILNHAETDVTAVYDRHSYDEEKREALNNWGEQLEEILAGDADEETLPIAPKYRH